MSSKPWIRYEGLCLLLSAPSGAGKTTVKNALMEQDSRFEYSISYTTRAPRDGEVDGVDYHFLSEQQFQEKIDNEEFIEYATVHKHLYGTGIELVERIEQGDYVILDIDVQGQANFKKKMPKAISVFVMPPSWNVLEARLVGRHSDSQEVIDGRLERARQEVEYYQDYDYLLINDDLDQAMNELKAIIVAEQHKTLRTEVDLNGFNLS